MRDHSRFICAVSSVSMPGAQAGRRSLMSSHLVYTTPLTPNVVPPKARRAICKGVNPLLLCVLSVLARVAVPPICGVRAAGGGGGGGGFAAAPAVVAAGVDKSLT